LRKNQKYFLLLISTIAILLSGVLVLSLISTQMPLNGSTKSGGLKGSITLNYNEYVSVSISANQFGKIQWSFSGSNTNVGITVRAMEYSEYLDFVGGYSYTYYSLSSGSYYSASGTWTPSKQAVWYIIFWNHDSVMQSTYLIYSATLVPGIPAFDFIPVIIGLLSVVYLSLKTIHNKKQITF